MDESQISVDELLSQVAGAELIPKQLESIAGATEFPSERHRWNTNEEVAAILLAFNRHAVWETNEVYIRPPSGRMLLYNRKKVVYRKDGYCWKKRRDGKTTREDHMKLKVQGIECIYGCYVHSAILSTFHRRCYWLLQNPDIVLVHYLNVPPTDSSRQCMPSVSLQQIDSTEWNRVSLIDQLRPMFSGVRSLDSSNTVSEIIDDAIESLVNHLLSQNSSNCNTGVHQITSTTQQPPKSLTPSSITANSPLTPSNLQPVQPGGNLMQLMRGNNGNELAMSGASRLNANTQTVHTAPLILNLTSLPGSGGLVILSSQSVEAPMCHKPTLFEAPLYSRPTAVQLEALLSNRPTNGLAAAVATFQQQQQTSNSSGSSFMPDCNVNTTTGCGVKSELLDADNLNQKSICSVNSDCLSVRSLGSVTSSELDPDIFVTAGSQVNQSVFANVDFRNLNVNEVSRVLAAEKSDCLSSKTSSKLDESASCHDAVMKCNESDVIVDELDDILHLVNESLGDCDDVDADLGHCDPDANLGHCDLDHNDQFNISPNLIDFKLPFNDGCDHTSKMTSSPVVEIDTVEKQEELLHISDFSPEWSYSDGGIKVLLSGSWSEMSSAYSVVFGDMSVPATLVQNGVLRCYTPAHSPGVVILRIARNGVVVSETKTFEFRSCISDRRKDRLQIDDFELKVMLVQRLQVIEKCLSKAGSTSINTKIGDLNEDYFVKWVERLSKRDWNIVGSVHEPSDLTLLHLSAGLGYQSLISALIKWSERSSSVLLEQEVDTMSVDRYGNSPLMWACARGHADAMIVLHRWNPLSVVGFANQKLRNIRSTPVDDWLTFSSGGTRSLSVSSHEDSPLRDDLHNKASLSQHHYLPSASQDTSPLQEQEEDLSFDSYLYDSTSTPRGRVAVNNAVQTLDCERQNIWLSNSNSCQQYLFTDDSSRHSGVTVETVESQNLPYLALTDEDTLQQQQQLLFTNSRNHSTDSSVQVTAENGDDLVSKKRTRLMKRTSIDILPNYRQMRKDSPKISKTASIGECDTIPDVVTRCNLTANEYSSVVLYPNLRTSNSDSHLSGITNRDQKLGESRTLTMFGAGLSKVVSGSDRDPMLPIADRDPSSPELFAGETEDDQRFSFQDIAMEMDSSGGINGLSSNGADVLHISTDDAAAADRSCTDLEQHCNQMMTLASQIIAAMPERIKLSPSQSKQLLADEINARRNRAASYGSFSSYSSCSSSTTPPTMKVTSSLPVTADDSGVSTPVDHTSSFVEYRYNTDLDVALSPQSTCVLSPYSFDIDSPPPTAAEFIEYFNAPATYMEKDFSQLTLSDEEQLRLYEAAKIIQSFYRRYKDKKEQQMKQQQREIEAAILIQSYYRRYKQFMYYKRMTQAAVLIQSQFRSYYAQKRFRRSREAATIIQNRYRAYKEHERYKRNQNAAIIIQQRFRSHYQRTHGKQTTLANTVQKMMADRDLKSDSVEQKASVEDTEQGRSSTSEAGNSTLAPTSEDLNCM